MLSLIAFILVCGGVGAAIGWFSKCSTGTCPLVANWRRGALFGAVLGAVLYFVGGQGGAPAMNESTANVTRINENQFTADVLQSASPVVVDFYATWCGPCRLLSPMLDKMAGSFTNRIKFVKINYDQAPRLIQELKIQGIPTLLFYHNGKLMGRVLGVPTREDLKASLESLSAMGTASTAGVESPKG